LEDDYPGGHHETPLPQSKDMSSPLDDQVRAIQRLITEGDFNEALDQIRNLATNGPRELADESILLSSRHARLERDVRRGFVADDSARRQSAILTAAALGLLQQLARRLPQSAVPLSHHVDSTEAFAGTEPLGLEKILGVNNLKQIAWIERGVHVSRAVCRILTPRGLGSGFLVAPRMVMTNNHVIPSVDTAAQTKVEFNYQLPFEGSREPTGAVRYDLNPDVFYTSPALDYTLVAVRSAEVPEKPAVETWGVVPLNPNADPVPDEHVVIIQHPNGGPKQIVLTANAVLQVRPPYLHYSTDTMPGSSGSPVFSDLWQAIAIHHAAGPSVRVGAATRHSNEGILMSAIVPDMEMHWPERDRGM
jgi:endonuclease G